ncbi:MAG TPA: hypothetical protein VIY96_05635, partial [Thermoanaerobaculia bacterium]
ETAGFLLQACDLLVFPYYPSGESSSAAARLGIASSRPVLVSDSGIFEELRGVAEVVSSIEPGPLAESIRQLSPARRAACEERVRRFAKDCDWARVASFVWGDLRSLSAPGGASGPASRVAPPPDASIAQGGLA